MVFPYFAQPDRFAAFLDGETACACCRQSKRCLDAAIFYGAETIDAICPDCLAGGRLKERDIFTCAGDVEALSRQIQDLHPGWSAAAVEKAVAEKTEILEKTTPPVVNWQDWPWPCADGDYGTFIGFGSKPLYNRLAKDMNGFALFQDSRYESDEEKPDGNELWTESLPDSEIGDLAASLAFATLFYVFENRSTGRLVTVWDRL
ncbi:MAG: CbrC family protein [Saprospiraceae bacterium]